MPRDRDDGSWIERQADLPDDEISLLCAELDSDGSGSVSLAEVGRRSCCTALPPGQQTAPCVRMVGGHPVRHSGRTDSVRS